MKSQSTDERISRLEMLLSEQEYTIETLNTVVTRQSRELTYLDTELELLKLQVKDLKTRMPDGGSGDEKPPHY